MWTCDTPEKRKPIDMMGALRAGQDLVPDYQAREALREQAAQARADTERLRSEQRNLDRAQALRMKVGKLVGNGDCNGATKLALEAGDFGLAGEVKKYCSP